MVEIQKFKEDFYIRQYGGKAHFCKKMNIFQSNLYRFLKDGKNAQIMNLILEYNAKSKEQKQEIFKDFKEEKVIKKEKLKKLENPLLTIDYNGEIDLSQTFNEKLR